MIRSPAPPPPLLRPPRREPGRRRADALPGQRARRSQPPLAESPRPAGPQALRAAPSPSPASTGRAVTCGAAALCSPLAGVPPPGPWAAEGCSAPSGRAAPFSRGPSSGAGKSPQRRWKRATSRESWRLRSSSAMVHPPRGSPAGPHTRRGGSGPGAEAGRGRDAGQQVRRPGPSTAPAHRPGVRLPSRPHVRPPSRPRGGPGRSPRLPCSEPGGGPGVSSALWLPPGSPAAGRPPAAGGRPPVDRREAARPARADVLVTVVHPGAQVGSDLPSSPWHPALHSAFACFLRAE